MRRAITGIVAVWGLVASAGTQLQPRLRVTAEERYDDGLFAARQVTGSQLMTKVSPQLGLDVLDRTFKIESWYAADVLFRHGTGTWSLDHRGALAASKRLSDRASVRGTAQVWRVTDGTSLPRLGIEYVGVPALYGRSELSALYQMSRRWTGRVAYRFEGFQAQGRRLGLPDTVPQEPPGFVHAPSAEAWYRMTRRTDMGLEYRYQLFKAGSLLGQSHGGVVALRHRLSRQLLLVARAGPSYYTGSDGREGFVPRAQLELLREGGPFEVGVVVGHDLVGATGARAAMWADYASAMLSLRVSRALRVYGAGNYFRNGPAPDVRLDRFWGEGVSQGYAVGGGLEWSFNRNVALIAALDRIDQLGGTAPMTRNIASVRVVWTAF